MKTLVNSISLLPAVEITPSPIVQLRIKSPLEALFPDEDIPIEQMIPLKELSF